MDNLLIKSNLHYTYTLAYPDGRVFYVGKGVGNRIHQHEREARRGIRSHKCYVIRKIWANGQQIIKTKLAYFETHEEAIQYEIALIFFMNGLTNKTVGGEGIVGYVLTKADLRKLSESHKGQVAWNKGRKTGYPSWNKGKAPSEVTRQKIREARAKQIFTEESHRKRGEARKGRPVSEETRRKISERQKGRKLSEESRRRISERQKGKIRGPYPPERGRKISAAKMGHSVSEETRRKISEANKNWSPEIHQKLSESHMGQTPWNKGRPMSEESKRKLSESQKKRLAQKRSALPLEPAEVTELFL